MIDRYSRKELKAIWEDYNKYSIWLDIELAAAEAMEKLKIIPRGVVKKVKSKAKINVKRILRIEDKVKHDVIAFLTSITEKAGKEARYLHKGMTSSDVLDTCFNLQLKQSGEILLKDIDELLKSIKKQAIKHKFTLCIGRSHGIHAEPITFGLKMLTFYQEFLRNKKRLIDSINEISTCAVSGAVGTFANIDPRVEKYVAKKLNLNVEPISTQIIPRDRHAQFFSTLGIIASSIERFAIEIRHLQRTEVLEVEEFFGKKQKGSSAMPHKKNPILSENLTGLARLIRSSVIPAMENVALWHERDISHSAVERNIGPDTTIGLDFALHRLNNVIKNLNIYPKNMLKNLNITNGIFFSQRVLLELTTVGFTREESYKIVQKNAMKSWNDKSPFYENIINDKKITSKIPVNKLKKLFNFSYHTKKINIIFKRSLNNRNSI
jgi:adenylosuccinate lyase